MRSVLLAQVRAHAARLLASTLAVVIAVGFVVATLVLNHTARDTLLASMGARYVGAAAVVTAPGGGPLTEAADVVDELAALDTVGSVDPAWETSVQASVPGRDGAQFLLVESVADAPALRWQVLADGRLPSAEEEMAVSERTRADVGDVLAVTTVDADGNVGTARATVTGIVDLQGDPEAGLYGRAFVTAEQAQAWGAADVTEIRLAAAPGAAPERVRLDAAATLADRDVAVRTGTQQAEVAAADLLGNMSALAAVLLVFGTVAVLVAGLVIANTFAVLLAQRTRELALLRCVGATARQVRRSVLGEALVTGVAAAAIGVAAGVGLAAAVSAVVGDLDSSVPLAGVSVPWYAVVAGLAVGTLVTLLAALAPARAATRVAPLAALRPVDRAPLRSRPGLLRLVLGLLLVVPGAALLAAGVVLSQVLIALPGGALSFLGVVMLAQRGVPPVVAAAGRIAGRVGGVPARLAAGNATRNPQRAAATATALLIGVTLTSAMVVGAASTRASATASLEAEFPTDVVVDRLDGGLPAALPAALPATLQAIDGVAATTGLLAGELTGPDGQPVRAIGVDHVEAAGVLRSTTEVPLPAPGQAIVPEWLAETWSVSDGETVALSGAGTVADVSVRVVGDGSLLLPTEEFRQVQPDAAIGEVWVRLDGSDPDAQVAAVDRLTDVVAEVDPLAAVRGVVTLRNQIDEVLDVLLLIVTGLLGVAVVIALIGVGNTLALSVVERRQENGLLRALGLTRGQLRGLLAWEALLVAGVAAVLGVLLGSAYGLVGAASVLGELGEVVLVVPWLQVGAIVAVATVAGLLASVLPARRAARATPVAALAG